MARIGQRGFYCSKKSRHYAFYAAHCWSATASKQCRNRKTKGLLQKSAHGSSIMDHLTWDGHTLTPIMMLWVSSFLCVLPALLVSREGNPVEAALQYCADDLPSRQGFDVGPFRWWRKWFSADQELPSSSNQALEECDNELFPNIHTLQPILCTFLSFRSFFLGFKACKLLSLAFVLQRWLGLKDMSGIGLAFLSVRYKPVKCLSWKSTVRVLFSFPIIFYQRNKNKDQDFCLGGSRLKRAVWNVLIMECFDFFLEFFFGGVSLVP